MKMQRRLVLEKQHLLALFSGVVAAVAFFVMYNRFGSSGVTLIQNATNESIAVKPQIEKEDIYSSIFCSSNDPAERVCRIRNLYFDADRKVFVLLKHPLMSHFVNTHVDDADLRFLDWSSVTNHNTYFWSYQITQNPRMLAKPVKVIREKAHLMKRFLPNNLMHILHDDWLGAWFVGRHLFPGRELYVFFDAYPERPILPFKRFYDFLGPNIQQHQLATSRIVKFEDAVVGNSKRLTWYQYGFKSPQGPLSEIYEEAGQLISNAAREFFGSIRQSSVASVDVALFSRTRNRKIVNEEELVSRLREKFTVKVVRFEEMSIEQIVQQLSVSKCVIGIHGSLFSLIPWLPKGALVIEIFPYAVPALNYTPYKTLSKLLQLEYQAVETKDHNRTIEYPDRPRLLGGIKHLQPSEQEQILNNTQVLPHKCCRDPNWLFRIYQDTIVDVNYLMEIMQKFI